MKKIMIISAVLVIALLATSVMGGFTITDTSSGRTISAATIWQALQAWFGGGITGAAVAGAVVAYSTQDADPTDLEWEALFPPGKAGADNPSAGPAAEGSDVWFIGGGLSPTTAVWIGNPNTVVTDWGVDGKPIKDMSFGRADGSFSLPVDALTDGWAVVSIFYAETPDASLLAGLSEASKIAMLSMPLTLIYSGPLDATDIQGGEWAENINVGSGAGFSDAIPTGVDDLVFKIEFRGPIGDFAGSKAAFDAELQAGSFVDSDLDGDGIFTGPFDSSKPGVAPIIGMGSASGGPGPMFESDCDDKMDEDGDGFVDDVDPGCEVFGVDEVNNDQGILVKKKSRQISASFNGDAPLGFINSVDTLGPDWVMNVLGDDGQGLRIYIDNGDADKVTGDDVIIFHFNWVQADAYVFDEFGGAFEDVWLTGKVKVDPVTGFGDANLDFEFNSADFVNVFANGNFFAATITNTDEGSAGEGATAGFEGVTVAENIAIINIQPVAPICAADLDNTDVVDFDDLVLVTSNFGCEPPASCTGDTNLDGSVNVMDLMKIAASWGPCP